MRTHNMVELANKNGKTYVSRYGTYSRETGFKLAFSVHSASIEPLINNLFNEDCWTEKLERRKMTQSDIEKALGYPIEIQGVTLTDLEAEACNRIMKTIFS